MAEVPMPSSEKGLVQYNNSYAAKSSLAQQQESKVVPKMETDISIRGQAIIKRKTPGQRFTEMFLNNRDLKTVFGTIMTEVVVPGCQEMFFNGVTDIISMLLWGETRSRPSRGNYRTGGGIVRDYNDYSSISNPSWRNRNRSDTASPGYSRGPKYYDVLYTSSAAAHSVLNSMRNYINKYNAIQVVALCDFIKEETGIQLEMNSIDAKKGWTNLTGIDVMPRYGGWILTYTDPIDLEDSDFARNGAPF